MTLRRGFKSEANWYAGILRTELGLQPYDPLSPWKLAAHLAIPIVPLSEILRFAPADITFLMTKGRDEFSAVTIFAGCYGKRRLICNNDGNAKTRQSADISHELSHAILGHSPSQLFEYDSVAEAEAKWMGPTLLVPDEAAHRIAARGRSVADAALDFAVSPDLMRMRLNVSGASKRIQRLRGGKRSA